MSYKRGSVLIETMIGALVALMLLGIAACHLTAFWQTWHQTTDGGRQRHWVAASFFWIGRDIDQASSVSIISTTILTLTTPEGQVSYRKSVDDSFYRRVGQTNIALASKVQIVNFREEEGLLWVTLTFTNGESWQTCFSLPQGGGP